MADFYTRVEKPDACGTVENVVYRNQATDYAVIELIDKNTHELVTAVGTLPYASEGEEVSLWGTWTKHPEFGKQLTVEHFEKQLPTECSDILRYLSSKTIRGIGPSTALKIVNRFGEETFEVIEKHPEWLTDISGITAKKAASIHKSFKEQAELRELMMLCGGKLGSASVTRIFRMWGGKAAGILHRDPYRLCRDVSGIGFERADEIASLFGVHKDADVRIHAGIDYVLMRAANMQGHSCIPKDILIDEVAETLGLAHEKIIGAVDECLRLGKIYAHGFHDTVYIFSAQNEHAEADIARRLVEIENNAVTFPHGDLMRLIERMESEWNIHYASMQREAIGRALSRGVMVLTGGPGTGKTTVIRALLRIFDIVGLKTVLAAPTGRAAKRMSEATVHDAKTLHRMLEMGRGNDEEEPKFHRDEENPLDEMVVIVDECSMIDLPLMAALVRAMRRGSRLILVGDADQLPSVGCGNVLHDIIQSGAFPVVCLNEIFRQAEESLIVTNAHRINTGEMPILDAKDKDFFFLSRVGDDAVQETITDLVVNRLPRAYGKEMRNKIQVITPTRRGKAGTEALNLVLQEKLNPPAKHKNEIKNHGVTFREGDRIMQVRNQYEIEWTRGNLTGMGIFNGDMGIIMKIDKENEKATLSFDERIAEYDMSMMEDIDHAYAITVHKSQGSEYPVILMPITWTGPALQTRNLLYTALTRAKEMVVLVGRSDIVSQMVSNDRQIRRFTLLSERIQARTGK